MMEIKCEQVGHLFNPDDTEQICGRCGYQAPDRSAEVMIYGEYSKSDMDNFYAELVGTIYPEGIKHPNQTTREALINQIKEIMRERDTYKQDCANYLTGKPIK